MNFLLLLQTRPHSSDSLGSDHPAQCGSALGSVQFSFLSEQELP